MQELEVLEETHKEYSHMCTSCPKSFKTSYPLKIHTLTHSTQKPYSCNNCLKSFNNYGSLHHHKRTHVSDDIPCDLCNEIFTSKDKMKRHKNRHHDGLKTTKCPVCLKLIESGSFSVHSFVHTGEKPFVCSICQKSFNNPGSLSRHRRSHSENENKYPCNICGKLFPSKINLTMHTKCHLGSKTEKNKLKKEKKVPREFCAICQKAFKSLKGHTISFHSTEQNFDCGQCSKSYKSATVLKDHTKRKHTDSLDYQCSICDKKFNVERVLKKHMGLHGDEIFKCKICSKGFPQLEKVKNHERIHNKEFAEIQCDLCPKLVRKTYLEKHKKCHGSQDKICKTCEKAFKTSSLKKHELTHIERKRDFECNICNARTHSINLLKRHKLIHTSETPYHCSIEGCGRRFNNPGTLSHHKRKHKNPTNHEQDGRKIT